VPRRKLIRDVLGFAATQYVIRGLLLVRGVVSAKLLVPFDYGAWNVIQLLMDYGLFASLGTHQGLDQAVPARIVEGDAARLDRLKRAGLFNIVALTGLFCAVCLTYLVATPNRIVGAWGYGGVLVALACVALTNLAFYHSSLLRSHGNIGAVSTWYFLQGLIGTVAGLALIPVLGKWGLLAGWSAATLAATAYIRVQGRAVVPLAPRSGPEGRELLAVGFHMFVFTASTLVTRSVDRLIVLKFLGTEALGYYTLAVMVLAFALYLPDSIAFVLYPRLVRDFRAAGNRPDAIRPAVERAVRALSVIVPGMCGLAYLLVPDFVMLALPDYLPGVAAIRPLCFGAGALAFVSLSSIVLMTVGRQRWLIPAASGVIAAGVALDILAIRAGLGIGGVARATLLAYMVDGAALLWLALGGLQVPPSTRIAIIARAFVPLALGFGIAFGLAKGLLAMHESSVGLRILRSLGVGVLFALGYALAVAPLVRGLGIRRVLSELNLPIPFLGRRAEAAGE
jgi:O-antigen/teichoic acid export membrane protein